MTIRNYFALLLMSLFSSLNINAQCALACLADFHLSLDASGNATLSAEDVLDSYGPACGTLVLEPSSFDCSDIGAPVPYTVTDLTSGNSCWGNIHVKFFVGAMSCFGDINVALGPTGTATLTPDMILFDPQGACIPGAIINPPTVSCADIGSPVFVTITDPVSGNSCWTNVNVSYNVGAMSCYADVNVALDPSGNLTLTPEMILNDPPGACIPGAIINPSTVSCADIGSPVFVTITDPVTGNSCWSNVNVTYNVGAMSCYADIDVTLDPSGSLILTPDMILNDPSGTCIPGAIINPATLTCADIGAPVFVTITDPVSGNSCWSNVNVRDPRPTSCTIVTPGTILCGDSGIPISVNTTGGNGPFSYDWKIKGNPKGWSILTGQGTDNITMSSGNKKINLEVTITDVCGKKRKCSVKLDCEDPAALSSSTHHKRAPISVQPMADAIEIFPNPATEFIQIRSSTIQPTETGQLFIIDQTGQELMRIPYEQCKNDGFVIDLNQIESGVYWLVFNNEVQGNMIKKFIKL